MVAGRRERKKLATREAIISSARRLFLARGYDKTTLEDICNDVDIHVTTFFGYFQSKEELAFTDTLDNLERFRRGLAEKPKEVDVLTFWWNSVAERERDVRGKEAAALIAFDHIPALRSRYADICRQFEDLIGEALAREAGVDPATDVYCHLLAATLVSVFVASVRWRVLIYGSDVQPADPTLLDRRIIGAFPSREELTPVIAKMVTKPRKRGR